MTTRPPSHEPSTALRRYAETGDDDAFRELVAAHIDLVYSTAARCLGEFHHLAPDVCQCVFARLAQKAGWLGDRIQPAAWLYRQTVRLAANAARAERRRRRRERIAAESQTHDAMPAAPTLDWSALAPVLDAALAKLPAADRDAVVLRYFQRLDHRAVGQHLGTTAETARKRTARALEKLRRTLARKGVTSTAAALATAMEAHAVTSAPTALISGVSAHALAAVAGGWTFPLAAAVGIVIAGAAGGFVAVSVLAPSPETTANQIPTSEAAATPLARPLAVSVSIPAYLAPLPSRLSLEEIVERLAGLQQQPSHALTQLNATALIDRVPVGEMPAFFTMVWERFAIEDVEAINAGALARWARSEPATALTFAVDNGLAKQANPAKGTSLIGTVLGDWAHVDHRAAARWLAESWDHPALQADFHPRMKLAPFLAEDVARATMENAGATRALAYLAGLPDAESAERASHGVFSGRGTEIYYREDKIWDQIARAVADSPSGEYRELLAENFYYQWGRIQPDRAKAASEALTDPAIERASAFGLLAVHVECTDYREDGDWSPTIPKDFAVRADRFARLMKAEGAPPAEIFERVVNGWHTSETLDWILANRSGAEADEALAIGARWSQRIHRSVEEDLRWAAAITDPAHRDLIGRGIARRWLLSTPEQAEPILAGLEWPRLTPAEQ
ncbi:hypothetical protein BH23VER1_BH23VER1_13670 [soil metagenome]